MFECIMKPILCFKSDRSEFVRVQYKHDTKKVCRDLSSWMDGVNRAKETNARGPVQTLIKEPQWISLEQIKKPRLLLDARDSVISKTQTLNRMEF